MKKNVHFFINLCNFAHQYYFVWEVKNATEAFLVLSSFFNFNFQSWVFSSLFPTNTFYLKRNKWELKPYTIYIKLKCLTQRTQYNHFYQSFSSFHPSYGVKSVHKQTPLRASFIRWFGLHNQGQSTLALIRPIGNKPIVSIEHYYYWYWLYFNLMNWYAYWPTSSEVLG